MTDLIPAPRPVPTREDRMRDARTDFATYLTSSERDQLDARAACAEQERDDALDDRDQARRERDQNAADLQAIANTNDRLRTDLAAAQAHHTELHNKIAGLENDLRSSRRAVRELLADLTDAGNTIDAAQAALHRAGHTDPTANPADLIDRIAAERDDARDTARRQRDDLHHELTQTRDALTHAGLQPNTTASTPELVNRLADDLDSTRQVAIYRQTVINSQAAELQHVGQVLTAWRNSFQGEPAQECDRVLVDLIDAQLVPTAERPLPPGLGSPSRAQEQPAELPAWVLQLVRGLDRYELEHPTLYRQNGDGTYSRWPCPGTLLARVPAEVRRLAEERQIRSEHGPELVDLPAGATVRPEREG
ncbi:hypothetical protein [Micromonospora sp. NPDC051006]|uniref:hypothetical protein n=1 Tax=Micromonospora sp. NPDC051006 TaxID=3364283 RepID=UPI0037A37B8C